MLTITKKNKASLQFAYMNPHVFKHVAAVEGITKEQSDEVAEKLKAVYGDDWFRFFIALKPATLNAKIGA